MKRALVVTYDFPPCTAPGAALRTAKLAHYLPEFGWEMAVVCRDERIAGAKSSAAVYRIPTPVPPRISYQLGAWTWARQILPHLRGLVRHTRPDLVYASSPPFPHALSAVRVARESGIPAVVDFRDSWSLDPHLGGGTVKQLAKRGLCGLVYPPLERRLIGSAHAILTNTASTRRAYQRKLGEWADRIHLVPNGFDEADFPGTVERPRRERPLLLYCGRFGEVGGRSPEIFLQAMRAVIQAGRPVDFEILGDHSEALRQAIRQAGLEEWVHARATVPHRDAIRAMREADVLVIYQSPSRNEVTPVAGKTYEYLRCGRPILAVVPAGDNADLVRRYAPVHALVTTGDAAAVAAAIGDLLDRPAQDYAPDPEFLEQYSRRSIARKVAAIFDEVLRGCQG